MSKFSNKSGSEGRGKSERSGGEKRPRRSSPAGAKRGDDKDPKSDGYKTKRSFTKNKSFRETKDTKFGEKPRRSFDKSEERVPFKRNYSKPGSSDSADRPKRSYDSSENKRPYNREGDRDASPRPRPERSEGGEKSFRDDPKRSFREKGGDKPYKKEFREDRGSESARKPERKFGERPERSERSDRPERSDRSERTERPERNDRSERKPFNRDSKGTDFNKPARKFDGPSRSEGGDGTKKKRFSKPRPGQGDSDESSSKRVKYGDFEEGKSFSKGNPEEKTRIRKPAPERKQPAGDGLTRLNKYLSNAGVASRRDADNLILGGTVKVNGVVVDQLGYKIKAGDKVTYGDAAVRGEKKVYLLLNKPKDYISTLDDPQERKTVMELIKGACKERVYPVGRLDRNTTGLLLFTNDGELTTKLTHPKFGVKKVYHVSLNKGLKPDDFTSITEGLELEDGMVKADDLAFVGEGKKEIGIEIHSGRNRIVRRLFEHLGYEVLKLDRVVFAGLTKKDLPRGKHRFLTAKEISFLQMIG